MKLGFREGGKKSRRKPVFLCLEGRVLRLRTRIYVDGYNLYYGCLKGSQFKWLDLVTLFEKHVLPSVLYRPADDAPPATMTLVEESAIKFFTAEILERCAKSADSVSSQAVYHNAITKHCGARLKICLGKYADNAMLMPRIPDDDPKRWPRDCDRVRVWKVEEKMSDVSIALQMFDDAMHGDVDQVVLVTNDTDLVPAFEMLSKRCPQVVRGLVIPTRKSADDPQVERQANTSLTELAHWVRRYITIEELQNSQMPDVIKGGRRPSIKPHSWYPRPDHIATMLDLARPVLGKEGKIMKWAREPNEWLGDARPIDLIETDEGAEHVFAYIRQYVADHKEGC